MLSNDQIEQCRPGLEMLAQPILPLVRLAGMLFISGPFNSMAEVVAELHEEVETSSIRYPDPQNSLGPFLAAMAPYERLKSPQPPERIILSEQGEGLEPMEAIDGWVAQNVLRQELETINSLLCGPCGCRLCCVGPSKEMAQHFFEIPLEDNETSHFNISRLNSPASRATSSAAEPALDNNGQPFYQQPEAGLIHWQRGWSLILPRASSCPNLDKTTGGCTIYPQRPNVCRRPQIFAYGLERQSSHDVEYEGKMLPAYTKQDKILAIWDCPYVQQFQDEIGSYAQWCEMEPIFKKNKG